MHDCRLNGGHFFVYKPQNHAFRCRRCSERFINSYTDPTRKHPWKCLIERCGYVACDKCSSILYKELAITASRSGDEDRVSLESLDMNDEDEKDKEEEGKDEKGTEKIPLCGTMDSGGAKDLIKTVMMGPSEAQNADIIEADDEDDEPYEVPTFVCRTARQAAAQAAMRRAHVRARPVKRTEGGRAE